MFNEKSSNPFIKLIVKEHQKDKIKGNKEHENKSQICSDSNELKDDMSEKKSTFKLLISLQESLKELLSIKRRFQENKDTMIERLKQSSVAYYKSKIGIKKIFDFIAHNNCEENLSYVLEPEPQKMYKQKLDVFYTILFELRNNNELMMKIID